MLDVVVLVVVCLKEWFKSREDKISLSLSFAFGVKSSRVSVDHRLEIYCLEFESCLY